MVIEVFVRDVREDTPGERQPGDAFLDDAVGTDLHEAVVASAFRHLCQHGIEADGVRRGVRGGKRLVVDSVDDRGDESRLVTEPAEQVVEQGGGRGLAVGACHAHEFQFVARFAVESGGDGTERGGAVRHDDVCHSGKGLFRQPFAYHCSGAVGRRLCHVVVPVACTALDGEEELARRRMARVESERGDVGFRSACPLQRFDAR